MKRQKKRRDFARCRAAPGILAMALLATSPALADHVGFVDCSGLIDLAGGDDAISVQVNLSGALIRAVANWDADLSELVSDVHSINAVILSLESAAVEEQARKAIRDMGKRLLKKGWERIAVVRDTDAEIQVMVIMADELIQGLVVLVVEKDEGEVICANIAGTVDLEKIQRIGDQWNVPGLRDIHPDD